MQIHDSLTSNIPFFLHNLIGTPTYQELPYLTETLRGITVRQTWLRQEVPKTGRETEANWVNLELKLPNVLKLKAIHQMNGTNFPDKLVARN